MKSSQLMKARMHNAETLEALLKEFNLTYASDDETKESIAMLLESLLKFYLDRHPIEEVGKSSSAKQLSLIDLVDEVTPPVLIEDEWLLCSQVEVKYPFIKATTISNHKKKMRESNPKCFNKCFQFTEINGLLALYVNVLQYCKFLLRNKKFASCYSNRLKDLIKGKKICLS